MMDDTSGINPDVPRIDKRITLTQLNRMTASNPHMSLEQGLALLELAKLHAGTHYSVDRVLKAFGVIE